MPSSIGQSMSIAPRFSMVFRLSMLMVTSSVRVEDEFLDMNFYNSSMRSAAKPYCTKNGQGSLFTLFNMQGKCSEQSEMVYENPNAKNDWALFLYPMADRSFRGAFPFCHHTDENTFEAVLCKRMQMQSKIRSVRVLRVNHAEEATEIIHARLGPNDKIRHLVLGGNGNPYALVFGPEDSSKTWALRVDDEGTAAFLDDTRNYLGTDEADTATVVLDSCLNGDPKDGKNMLQFVAHHLAPALVFGSKKSFSGNEFFVTDTELHLSTGRTYQNMYNVIQGKNQQNYMTMSSFPEGAQDWTYYQNYECSKAVPSTLAGGFLDEFDDCFKWCEQKSDCIAFAWYPYEQQSPTEQKWCFQCGAGDAKLNTDARPRLLVKP